MNSNNTPNALSQPFAPPQHKRTYQACLPCRRRKVRCDLGSVDSPGDPPCQRCRREKKECTFSETRRKRRLDENGAEELDDDYIARNKRASGFGGSGDSMDGLEQTRDLNGLSDPGADPYGSGDAWTVGNGASKPQLGGVGVKTEKLSNREVRSDAAAVLFHNPIFQPADALNMLVDAAHQTEFAGGDDGEAGESSDQAKKLAAEVQHRESTAGTHNMQPTAIDPAIVSIADSLPEPDDADMKAAIRAWSGLKFVRAGLFTAREGIAYILYFCEYMAPLTPVSIPDFRNIASHPRLLAEEQLLTVTLLTIASRYKRLGGAGKKTRSFMIHDRLWSYLQSMITRMFWAQEQFGGGFCGAGKTTGELEARRRGLRTLGTVESLLLLSDWLPRAMHFPPGDDDDEILIQPPSENDEIDTSRNLHLGWIEPAIRSDRMCWSLVGAAYTLSFELGVFDSLIESGRWSPGPQAKTGYDSERADRIGRMLFIYISQNCGRLGFPNMMPSQGNETNFNFLKMDVPPGSFPGPYESITVEDKIQRAWAELTTIIRQSNTEMFESKRRTRQAVDSGEHFQFMDKFKPKLQEWKDRLEQTDIPQKARLMLMMEYEYARFYINSLSLQAVMEKASDQNGSTKTSSATPPALMSSKAVDSYKQSSPYIKEVIDASRSLLRIVSRELTKNEGLKHAPVRVHFRVISAAMFLLKTLSMGSKEVELTTSMNLVDEAIKAIRSSVVDDVHLSLRIADLLAGITSSLRTKFVRFPKKHQHRSSTSHPAGNPRSNVTGQRVGYQVTAKGNNGNLSRNPASNEHLSAEDLYAPFGTAPRIVDLNDASITIMPPPDFLGHLNPNSPDLYSPHNATFGDGPPPIVSPTLSNVNVDNSHGHPFSPSVSAAHAFSPVSVGSGGTGGYDWLAVDFHPILSGTNNTRGGANGVTNNTAAGGNESATPSGAGTHAWSGGAFGPEISENLEMLGTLGNWPGWSWDENGPPGQDPSWL